MYLVQEAIRKTLEKVRAAPIECGFDPTRNIYQPLKLVKVVVGIVNTLILDLQDNANLYEVPLPPSSPHATELTKLKQPPKYCVDAIKNTRRTMEDKHMIIDDFNAFFKTQVCDHPPPVNFFIQIRIFFRTPSRRFIMESSMVTPALTPRHMRTRTSTITLPSTRNTRRTSRPPCAKRFSSPTSHS